MALKAQHGNEPYVALLVRAFDNQPIFKWFNWGWKEIRQEATERGIDGPHSPQVLKQWASKHGLAGKLKSGSPGSSSRVPESTPLLSPAPVFGHILR